MIHTMQIVLMYYIVGLNDRKIMEGISRLKSAGLQDNTFFGYTFANCDGTHPCAKYAHRYVEYFTEFQKNGQGLLFWGNVGTGKTFLAGCIANALMEKNIPVLEMVYLVIDERYKSGKPFIITTNLSLEELQNLADLEHGRIYDRIMERCAPVAFSGKNYRTGKGRANMENASGILRE